MNLVLLLNKYDVILKIKTAAMFLNAYQLLKSGKESEAEDLIFRHLYAEILDYIATICPNSERSFHIIVFNESLLEFKARLQQYKECKKSGDVSNIFKNIARSVASRLENTNKQVRSDTNVNYNKKLSSVVAEKLRNKPFSDIVFANSKTPTVFYLEAFKKMDNTKCKFLILLHNVFGIEHREIAQKAQAWFTVKNERSSISQLSECMRKLSAMARALHKQSKFTIKPRL